MAGKTYDFPFGIEWVAEKCGLLDGKYTRSGAEINVRCPSENCRDCGEHLAINTVKDQWQCMHCGSKGGLLHLYMLIYGCSMKEAAAALYKIWRGAPPEDRPTRKTMEVPLEVVAPIERRHSA